MPDNGTSEGRDEALERELRELGRSVDYPPTPDLAASVRQRLDAERRPLSRRAAPPSWALAAAVLAVFVVVPFVSYALFDSLGGTGSSGVGGGQVAGSDGEAAPESAESDARSQDAPPSAGTEEGAPEPVGTDSDLPSSAAGPAPPWGERLDLGQRISLEAAETRTGGLLLPAAAGRPDQAYATAGPTSDGVALLYGTREDFDLARGDTGFVLTQVPGGIEAAFGIGSGAGAETVEVGGKPGVWVSGPEDPGAEDYRLTEGLEGSALFFARGNTALRLESNLARDEAIRLAESVG